MATMIGSAENTRLDDTCYIPGTGESYMNIWKNNNLCHIMLDICCLAYVNCLNNAIPFSIIFLDINIMTVLTI